METTRLYIVRAEYAGDVSLHIFFSDGTSQIEHGNIVWGKNWDMIFPSTNLHLIPWKKCEIIDIIRLKKCIEL